MNTAMTNADFDGRTTAQIIEFAPAVRKGSHVLCGVYGFSGSGKTLSALYLARGLVGENGRIAMIDTETGRGLVYAMEAGGFDHAELTPPFTPERYIEAIKTCESAGYDALILDSGSHEWEGIGGVIEMADAENKKGLAKWANPKARHKKYVNALLNTRMHIFICLRAKEKMVQITAKTLAQYPGAKVGDILSEGMIAIQDKRFIYEMTAQLFLPIPPDPSGPRGVPVLEKCPKDLLGAFPQGEQISIATGKRIAEWVAGGEPVDHTAAELRHTAEEVAAGGTEKMRAWWGGLAVAERKQLEPRLANLRSIAATADAEAERQAQEAAGEPDDGRLDNPFGDGQPNGGAEDPPATDAPAATGSDKPADASTKAALAIPDRPDGDNLAVWVTWRKAAIGAIKECVSDGALIAFLEGPALKGIKPDTADEIRLAANTRIDEIAAEREAEQG